MLDSPGLLLEPQPLGDIADLRVGLEVFGTVDVVDDEDGRSWVATVPVLQADLV